MFIGSADAIPAGHVGFVLPLGGHQFLLTGTPDAIAVVAEIVKADYVQGEELFASDIELYKGDKVLNVGYHGHPVTGHYFALAEVRRIVAFDLEHRRLPTLSHGTLGHATAG